MEGGSSKSFWPIVAAVSVGVGFVGYCIYFDQKRRNAPDFREKLKEKRKKEKQTSNVRRPMATINPQDQEEMRRFFLEQIQTGEDCLSRGDIDSGVDHLSKAVAVCSQPENLLTLFQQTLPPELFQEIIRRLPSVTEAIYGSNGPPSKNSTGPVISELDLE